MDESKKISKLSYFYLPIAIVLIALVLFLFKILQKDPQMPIPPALVTLTEVRKEVVILTDTFIGLMEADQEVAIKPRVSGFLIERPFNEGEKVKKDQLLFKIEPYKYEADLALANADKISAQAELTRAQADFTRISDLYKKGSTTKADLDERKASFDSAQAKVMQAQAQIKQAELNLSYTQILAPFDSQIRDSDFHIGSLIDPNAGQILTSVVSLDPIIVSFGISEKIITSFRNTDTQAVPTPENTVVRIKIGGNNYYPKSGQLIFVDSSVDNQTDTVKFKASFENPDNILIPGQMVTVEINAKEQLPSLLIPQKAVLTDPEGKRFVMVPKKTEGEQEVSDKIIITIGKEVGADFVVTSGLSEGQKVIENGLVYMSNPLPIGIPVTVMSNKPPADAPLKKGGAK